MIIGLAVVLGLIIFAYTFYSTFFPVLKTNPSLKSIQGKLRMLRERGEQGVKAFINEGYISLFDARVGFCGGSVVEKLSVDTR